MNRLLILSFSAIISMAMLAAIFGRAASTDAGDAKPAAGSSQAARTHVAADTGDEGATVLQRNSSGQFRIEGKINGTALPFLIDTGADVVILSQEAAQEANIFVDPTQFEPLMQTANGTGSGVRVPVSELEVAGKRFEGIDVVVMEDIHTNLLGQSILRQLGRIELKGDRMVIERN